MFENNYFGQSAAKPERERSTAIETAHNVERSRVRSSDLKQGECYLYKICTHCKEELILTKFARRKDRDHHEENSLFRYNTICLECAALKSKLKFVGIDKAEYDRLRFIQEDCCRICGKHELICRNGRNIYYGLNIDHCHTTGKVRGLLCNSCNLIIGHANDKEDILKNAIKYLQDTKI